ncbi:hypothetical protein CC2G_002180 [Coprinopsis cinerea AmutBmut pab1-1]|nr:hypothetical protein CC2G_002180 [Coprinopsis cinerea AmutBmut pab1-1]
MVELTLMLLTLPLGMVEESVLNTKLGDLKISVPLPDTKRVNRPPRANFATTVIIAKFKHTGTPSSLAHLTKERVQECPASHNVSKQFQKDDESSVLEHILNDLVSCPALLYSPPPQGPQLPHRQCFGAAPPPLMTCDPKGGVKGAAREECTKFLDGLLLPLNHWLT